MDVLTFNLGEVPNDFINIDSCGVGIFRDLQKAIKKYKQAKAKYNEDIYIIYQKKGFNSAGGFYMVCTQKQNTK